MERLQAAIRTVYLEWEEQAEPEHPLWTYGRLSDLCGGDFWTRRKLKLLFDVNRILPLFTIFSDYGKERGEKILLTGYPEVSGVATKGQFKELVTELSKAIFPEKKKPKPEETSATSAAFDENDSMLFPDIISEMKRMKCSSEPEKTETDEYDDSQIIQEYGEDNDEEERWERPVTFSSNPIRATAKLIRRVFRRR